MNRANLFSAELSHEDDDPQRYEAGYARLAPLLGSEKLGATIYELEPGNSNWRGIARGSDIASDFIKR